MENMDYCIVGLPNIPTIGRDDELPRLILESIRLSRLKNLRTATLLLLLQRLCRLLRDVT